MKKRILFLMVSAVFAVSCSLDKFPLDRDTVDSYFKDEEQLQNISNTFYDDLFDGPFYDDESDICFKTSLPSLLRGGNLRTVPSSGGGWTWSTLRNINNMLDNIHRCDNESVRIKYTAVARFFRAYFYFLKVRDFGDVPWYDHELSVTEKDELYKARDSRDFVMTKMIEDIDYAIRYLPDEANAYRVTKWTALAFKSRFCLFEGTWRKYHGNGNMAHDADYYLKQAADAADEFISTSPYRIYGTGKPDTDYMMLFASQNAVTEEIVLAKNYSLALSISHFGTYDTFGQNKRAYNKKFVDSFLMKDGSRFTDRDGWETMEYYDQVEDRDPRLAQIIRCPGYHRIDDDAQYAPDFGNTCTGYQVVEYAQSYNILDMNWAASDNDLPIFRAAEVYLNYAEAMAERTDVSITQDDIDKSINPLRTRAGMPGLDLKKANADPCPFMSSSLYGYSNVSGQNKGVILEIRRERTIELTQEGDFRWYDLMRWKEGKCIEQGLYGMYFPGTGEYDLDRDGKADVCIYEGDEIPETEAGNILKLGNTVILSGDSDGGYVDPHRKTQHIFDEARDYLFPIPSEDLAINGNLVQNPGWTKK